MVDIILHLLKIKMIGMNLMIQKLKKLIIQILKNHLDHLIQQQMHIFLCILENIQIQIFLKN
jgi:hypothetical protein